MSTKPLTREEVLRWSPEHGHGDPLRASVLALLSERDELRAERDAIFKALPITTNGDADLPGQVRSYIAERDQLAAACDIFKGRIQALEMERDEAREQRNRAQMTWDDEHDAKLKALTERDTLADLLKSDADVPGPTGGWWVCGRCWNKGLAETAAPLRERVKVLEDALRYARQHPYWKDGTDGARMVDAALSPTTDGAPKPKCATCGGTKVVQKSGIFDSGIFESFEVPCHCVGGWK